ncbi:MAG: ATP-binding protein [Caldilineaceae bacterium]|nr:ATP-binding protein [Caldilineaceae bacterium]
MTRSINYPFTAIVGQEQMRLALVLNAVNPAIGGVLIRGEKGTAKSTAARALAALLPPQDRTHFHIELETEKGCELLPHTPGPLATSFVELPIGASSDRVTGTLDIEAALRQGQRRFEPGLLARAHGGILYVDEVNLLPDHIVDILLDVAVSGVNIVEREGVSVRHPSRFLLVGTMNPEEGELRPQLLDRFGLAVDVTGPSDPVERAEVVRRRIAYEADAPGFAAQYGEAEAHLAQCIASARQRLAHVTVSDALLGLVTHICAGSGVDGMRADITLYKAARTLAAWEGRNIVDADDVRRAAELVLPHRRRRQPFEEPGIDRQQLDSLMRDYAPRQERQSGGDRHSREVETTGDTAQEDE